MSFASDVYSIKTRKPIVATFCEETRRGYARGIRCVITGLSNRQECQRLALELENALDDTHMQLFNRTYVPTLRMSMVQVDPALKHRGIVVRWQVGQ
jgi:hypothetical protein